MELYPSRYEEWVDLRNGRKVFLRPVRETDGPLLVKLFEEMSSSSVRLRFLSPLHHLPEQLVYRFTHVEYGKDFGLVALINENFGPIIGVARYAYDLQSEMPEFAVAVRDDWQGNGLGSILFMRVIKVGREHGYSRFVALVDPQNRTMINIFKRSGYDYKISRMEQDAYFIEIQGSGEKGTVLFS
jgi:acetyltransferase